MHERKPDVVEFVVTTTIKHVVNVADWVAAQELTRSGDWLQESRGTAAMGRAIKQEIPEDRPGLELVAVAVYAEGEFICEYDRSSRFVTETDDRDAIVIAAMAASIELPDEFAKPGSDVNSDACQRLF